MTFLNDSLEIAVWQDDRFGKNPGLWIRSQTENAVIKVASFGSKEKADMFVEYLMIFLGLKEGELNGVADTGETN